ncbi:MAG: proprotein convertase P-domain-containing protein [Ignavibacteria bacterium]|nr:proprotein convertase P-domain-containing protein [Ignavibacteria bacterium]
MVEVFKELRSLKAPKPKQFGLLFALTMIFSTSAILVLSGRANANLSWNQACLFNGVNTSYISVPNSAALNITGSLTLEAWINQTSTTASARGIISKGGTLGTSLRYGLRLVNGRIIFIINGGTRLMSKSTTFIQPGAWYHVSATFNSGTNEYGIYINGVLDSSMTSALALPQSNTDSLFVGISGSTSAFNGKLDEVRVWDKALSADEVSANYRSVVATSSGIYNGLVLSLPFQKENSVSPFSTTDFSASENPVQARNVSPVSYSHQPSSTISTNQAAVFDGNEDYIAAPDTSTIEFSDEMTLDLWIYPRATQTCNVMKKGNQYILNLISNKVCVTVNGVLSMSDWILASNNWTRVTVSFKSDSVLFYINGGLSNIRAVPFGAISTGSDSLFIGGTPGAETDFNGMIDELRIQNRYFRSQDSVFALTYKALDQSTDLSPRIELCYNLDGYLRDSEGDGGPEMYFRNNAGFSNPASDSAVQVSPLLRGFDEAFTKGFYLPSTNLEQLLPPSGTTGSVTMNIPIYKSATITSMEVMIAVNHSRLSDLNVDVVSPSGDSLRLMSGILPVGFDNSARVIFSDQADSIIGTGKYSSISGYIRPQNSLMGKFGGTNSKGLWRIRIRDIGTGHIGRFHVCGIRINDMEVSESNLSLRVYFQGLYKTSTNNQNPDTVRTVLMNYSNPSIVYDSAKSFVFASGFTELSFRNVPYDAVCFLKVLHRNSIETWTSNPISFNRNNFTYNLTANPTTAFGQNVVQVRLSPATYAIYSGDVNQDRTVDATDVSLIDNDASNFVSGYVVTDLTGDDFVDGTDFAIADNNAANFVSAVLP